MKCVAFVLTAACVCLSSGAVNDNEDLQICNNKVLEARREMEKNCPETLKREGLSRKTVTPHLGVCKAVYKRFDCALTKCNKMSTPEDCQEYYEGGYRASGVYYIHPQNSVAPFEVYCDFSDLRGWTVIQTRLSNLLINFQRTWEEYKHGFGDVDSTHWLGNEKIHLLTQTNQKLRVHLTDNTNVIWDGEWELFHIADEVDNYRLTISTKGFVGSLQDHFSDNHNGLMFTTLDRDNDNYDDDNCARLNRGGWWYGQCFNVHLNINATDPEDMAFWPISGINARWIATAMSVTSG